MKKVLIVDDEHLIIKIIQFKLESSGFEVISAFDGVNGLQMAIKESPDIILLDIMMPGMNGYTVLDILKKDERTKNIPVIMVTARSQEVDKEKAESLGASAYIPKPFSPQHLVETINCVI